MQLLLSQDKELHQAISDTRQNLPLENECWFTKFDITPKLQPIYLSRAARLKNRFGLDITGFVVPTDEVSGDYYDVLEHNGCMVVGIGDVTGHGLESGLLALMVKIAVRTLLINNISEPKILLTHLNRVFYENIKRINSRRGLTLTLLKYCDGVLQISGQHEEVIIIKQNGYLERIDTIDLGLMMGLKQDISQFLHQIQVTLQPGEGIVLYTDGITEAQNAAKVEYGLKRLCAVIKNHGYRSATEIGQAICNDVQQYIGNQPVVDDLTLLVFKRNGIEKGLEI